MLNYTNGHHRAISGAGLAQRRRRMSAAERAVFAADIIDGRVVLQGLTAKAIAALVGVNLGYVHAALRLTPEQRVQACRGERPLILPRARAHVPASDWTAVNDRELVEVIRRAGVDRTLNAAIAAEHATTATTTTTV